MPAWAQNAWQAFLVLHTQRTVGFAPSPLSVSDILSLLAAYGVEGSERQELFELILALDSEWLAWARARNDGDGSNTSAGD